jgi:hypothetical protein
VLMAVGTPSAVAAVLDAVDTGAAHDTAAGCPVVSAMVGDHVAEPVTTSQG